MSVYIHGGLRSPIGVLNGQYKHMRPEMLGAQLINELVRRHDISQVDGIFCGNAVGTGGNIGRLMGLMWLIGQKVCVKTLITLDIY